MSTNQSSTDVDHIVVDAARGPSVLGIVTMSLQQEADWARGNTATMIRCLGLPCIRFRSIASVSAMRIIVGGGPLGVAVVVSTPSLGFDLRRR
jgi:hypothetical protein